MALQITKARRVVEAEYYRHEFEFKDEPGAGYSFDVTVDGVPVKLEAPALENYRLCQTGTVRGEPVIDFGIVRHEHSYVEPAEGKCVCGRIVVLEGDVECSCGRWFNQFGQELNRTQRGR